MEYQIVRSRRRTLAIEVKGDGSVLVRSPFGVPTSEIEAFLSEKASWIAKQQEKIKKRPTLPTDPEVIREFRSRAKAELIPLTLEYARRYGFSVKSVRITSARTRFGSCGADNAVCLSLYLMLYPAEAREYVILHELCHTVHHNHSRRFYALLDRLMPDHRQRRALLR